MLTSLKTNYGFTKIKKGFSLFDYYQKEIRRFEDFC